MRNDSDLSVVLFGYGLAGQVFHGPLVASTPGMQVAAIVTSNPERIAQARADFPQARIVGSADEIWARADDYDIAVIGTANVTHVPFAMEALRLGMHVVIDKPIAGTAADAQQIATYADEVGLQAHPFQNRRWDTEFLSVRSIVDSGRIGTVQRFDSHIDRLRVAPKGSWRESAEAAQMGGVLFDLGAHAVDQALALLGPVVRVSAIVQTIRFPGLADDDAMLTLEHASGAVSNVVVSQARAASAPRFVVNASAGGIRIDYADGQEDALKAGVRPRDLSWGVEPDDAWVEVTVVDDNGVDRVRERPALGEWDRIYPEIRDSIRGVGPAPVLMSDAIANLRVLEAARQSAESGLPVELNPPAAHQ